MPAFTKAKAVQTLASAVDGAEIDELVEIYNELFPQEPTSEKLAQRNPAATTAKIQQHFKAGLKVEEILDLWAVVFPDDHHVWFDEQKKQFHFEQNGQEVLPLD